MIKLEASGMRTHHPLADLFPLMEGPEFGELVASIKANGLRHAVVVLDDMVLDGRNRQRACKMAGVKCSYTPFRSVGDPLAYVIDANLNRRHLNDDQRRMVAAKMVNMAPGRPSEKGSHCANKTADAVRLLNVDRPGTKRARHVLAHAIPEIRALVDQGKVSVHTAALVAQLATLDQQQAFKLGKDGLRRKAKEIRAKKLQQIKRREDQARALVGSANTARSLRKRITDVEAYSDAATRRRVFLRCTEDSIRKAKQGAGLADAFGDEIDVAVLAEFDRLISAWSALRDEKAGKREQVAEGGRKAFAGTDAAEVKVATSDPVQEPDCEIAEQQWQRSSGNFLGEIIAMQSFWDREFGKGWREFQKPSPLVTLAHQAVDELLELRSFITA